MKSTKIFCDLCEKEITDKSCFPARHVIINISPRTNMITTLFSDDSIKIGSDEVCGSCTEKLQKAVKETILLIKDTK